MPSVKSKTTSKANMQIELRELRDQVEILKRDLYETQFQNDKLKEEMQYELTQGIEDSSDDEEECDDSDSDSDDDSLASDEEGMNMKECNEILDNALHRMAKEFTPKKITFYLR